MDSWIHDALDSGILVGQILPRHIGIEFKDEWAYGLTNDENLPEWSEHEVYSIIFRIMLDYAEILHFHIWIIDSAATLPPSNVQDTSERHGNTTCEHQHVFYDLDQEYFSVNPHRTYDTYDTSMDKVARFLYWSRLVVERDYDDSLLGVFNKYVGVLARRSFPKTTTPNREARK